MHTKVVRNEMHQSNSTRKKISMIKAGLVLAYEDLSTRLKRPE